MTTTLNPSGPNPAFYCDLPGHRSSRRSLDSSEESGSDGSDQDSDEEKGLSRSGKDPGPRQVSS